MLCELFKDGDWGKTTTTTTKHFVLQKLHNSVNKQPDLQNIGAFGLKASCYL